jgi:hypothetical protein
MSTLKKLEKNREERPRDELEGALLPPGPAPAPISLNDPLLQPPSAVAVPIASTTDAASAAAATSSISTIPAAASPLEATIADTSIPTVAAIPVVAAVPVDNQYSRSSYPSQDAQEQEKVEKEIKANRGVAAAAAAASSASASDMIGSAPYLPAYDEGFEQGNRDYAESAEMFNANLNGKINKNEEMTDIHRAKQKISAKTYNEKEAIREANEEAKRRNRSGVQIRQDNWFRYEDTKPAYKEGDADNDTYVKKKGGGYEVNEYEVSEYDTKEYETTEYKSVYED